MEKASRSSTASEIPSVMRMEATRNSWAVWARMGRIMARSTAIPIRTKAGKIRARATKGERPRGEEERRVGPEDQGGAVRHVEDPEHPEDEGEPEGPEGIDAALEDAADQELEQNFHLVGEVVGLARPLDHGQRHLARRALPEDGQADLLAGLQGFRRGAEVIVVLDGPAADGRQDVAAHEKLLALDGDGEVTAVEAGALRRAAVPDHPAP